MVGNDIVDLRDSDSDSESLSPRFDSRVFSVEERAAIALADDSSRHRWRLWAAKEACFKLVRQLARAQAPARHVAFSPQQFQTRIAGNAGRVVHEGIEFAIVIREGDDWLHALALPVGQADDGLIVRECEIDDPHPDHQSEAVRELACKVISEQFGYPRNELSIRSQDRIPGVWLRDRRLPISLSLSHQGQHVAMACSTLRWPAALCDGLQHLTTACRTARPPKHDLPLPHSNTRKQQQIFRNLVAMEQ